MLSGIFSQLFTNKVFHKAVMNGLTTNGLIIRCFDGRFSSLLKRWLLRFAVGFPFRLINDHRHKRRENRKRSLVPRRRLSSEDDVAFTGRRESTGIDRAVQREGRIQTCASNSTDNQRPNLSSHRIGGEVGLMRISSTTKISLTYIQRELDSLSI